MKKVMNKIILTLSFAIAFVLAATLPVGAAGEFERINNVEVSGDVTEYNFAGPGLTPEKIYLVENKDAQINLNYISNSTGKFAYQSAIAIVKCAKQSNLSTAKVTCSVHNVTREGENTITDALRSESGFTFKLSEYYASTVTKGNDDIVNGVNLASLDSVYGLKNMTFILIDYVAKTEYYGLFGKKTKTEAEYSEVITILNLEDIGGGAVSADREIVNGKIKAIADASFPVAKISYFVADAGLTVGNSESDFNQAAATAGVQVQAVTPNNVPDAIDTTERKGIVYRTEFEVDAVDGKSCYVYIQDELGNYNVIELPSDATQDVTNDGGGSMSGNDTDTTNPLANTDLGKIILIILVSVLVLAAVLVIVQKIVDHKRRLY